MERIKLLRLNSRDLSELVNLIKTNDHGTQN
jgi:hypothetical protein